MPVDALPEFAPPMIEVQTEALGLSAPEVEEPGDAQPRGAPERHTVAEGHPLHHRAGPVVDPPHLRAGNRRPARAPARPGAPGAVVRDPERRQAARHHPAALDDQSRDDGRASRRRRSSPIEMGILARWNIRPALLAVPGVANVSIWGQRERQLQVQVEPRAAAGEPRQRWTRSSRRPATPCGCRR